MKRVIQTTAIMLSMILCHTSYANYAKPINLHTGKIRCDAQIDEKDKVVLFVNGILNSPNDAEESRLELEKVFSSSKTIAVKKVYNDTQGFLPDTEELNTIGNLQFTAKKEAILWLLNDLENKLSLKIQKNNNAELREDTIKHMYAFFKGLYVQQSEVSNAKELLYNPNKNSTNFQQAFKENLLKKLDEYEKKKKIDKTIVTETALGVYIRKLFEDIGDSLEQSYNSEYRDKLMFYYMSDSKIYGRDNAAVQRVNSSVEQLKTMINEYVLSGKKLVIVPHSQGNHIVELAYSKLQKEHGINSDFMKAIRVVGVASVSSSTPNNVYITSNKDSIVLSLYDAVTYDAPLKGNFEGNRKHSFINYLSEKNQGIYTLPANAHDSERFGSGLKDGKAKQSSRTVIHLLILDSLNIATPMPAKITTDSPLTAQLRWGEEYNDMDLHIQEPNESNVVFYGNSVGKYGYLDRDDTDFHGPEHYFVNKEFASCDKLQGKVWDFSVHQYPSGGVASPISFMVKLNNGRKESRTFKLNPWPADKVKVATVNFDNTMQNNLLGFTIKFYQ